MKIKNKNLILCIKINQFSSYPKEKKKKMNEFVSLKQEHLQISRMCRRHVKTFVK